MNITRYVFVHSLRQLNDRTEAIGTVKIALKCKRKRIARKFIASIRLFLAQNHAWQLDKMSTERNSPMIYSLLCGNVSEFNQQLPHKMAINGNIQAYIVMQHHFLVISFVHASCEHHADRRTTLSLAEGNKSNRTSNTKTDNRPL